MNRIIELIVEIDEIIDGEYFFDNIHFEDHSNEFKNFSNRLNEIFASGLKEEDLNNIMKINYKEIFLLEDICEEYTNNKIREEIKQYIIKNNKLKLNIDLVKKYIKDDYKLAKYIDTDKIIELVNLNEKVILYLDVKYLTKEFVLEQMKNSIFISEIFLGIYGDDNDLFKYSKYYKNDNEINKLLYQQIKDKLDNDYSLYICASELIKSNQEISAYVTKLEPKMKAYITEKDCK